MIRKRTSLMFFILFALTIAGCGSSGGDLPPGKTTYTVGGTVSGLSGTLVLRNNGADDMTMTQDGAFTFATQIADGGSYAVSVTTQPSGQTCVVENGSGTVTGANITNVIVTCHNSGSLDSGFGTGGKVITPVGSFGEEASAAAIQADGKVVIAGSTWNGVKDDFVLARYNANGALDTAFDADGIVTTSIGSGSDVANAVAIQSDGKILAAGFSYNGADYDFALVRYKTDGTLDTAFAVEGIATTPIGSGNDYAIDMAVQSDGKIVVAGYSFNGADNDFGLARYNTDGSLDTTFDGDGKVTTAIGSGNDIARALAVQSDGKIVVAGYSNSGINNDIAVVRYNSDGSLDTAFDGDGKVITAIGSDNDVAYATVIQSDGKIIVAGYYYNGANNDFVLVRYSANGALDTAFDADGIVTTGIGTDSDQAYALGLQPDGKIVVAGYVSNGLRYDVALARYNANGTLDTAFDTDGIVTTAIGSFYDYANSMAIQSDGRIIIAGYSDNGDNDDIALARYWP